MISRQKITKVYCVLCVLGCVCVICVLCECGCVGVGVWV